MLVQKGEIMKEYVKLIFGLGIGFLLISLIIKRPVVSIPMFIAIASGVSYGVLHGKSASSGSESEHGSQ